MEIKVVAWKKPIDPNKHVFIVGSGAAGMMSALSCAQYVPVTILTDGKLGRSNSIMAQGGITNILITIGMSDQLDLVWQLLYLVL